METNVVGTPQATIPAPYKPAAKESADAPPPTDKVTISGAAPEPTTIKPVQAPVPEGVEVACKQAIALMEGNKLADAVELLNGVVDQDPSSQSHALLGTAFFRLEKYDKAVEHLQIAMQRDPEDAALPLKLKLAVANDLGQIQDDVANDPLDKKDLLGPPNPGVGATYDGPPPPHGVKGHLGHTLGVLGRGTLNVAGHVLGGLVGGGVAIAVRAFGRPDKGEIYSTWSRKHFIKGMLMLAYMRTHLNKHNIKDTYPEGTSTGFCKELHPGLKPPESALHCRTADGTWNNLDNPKEGAAGTRFGRNVDLEATRVDMKNLYYPNPRKISQICLTRDEGFKAVPFLNMLAASWIQFMVHDWVSHGDPHPTDVHAIPLDADDPIRKEFHMTHMFLPKSVADPTTQPGEAGNPPTAINEVTHWWDGSQLYGSDVPTQMKLRSQTDGKMRLGANGRLPLGKDGIEEVGFKRNFWVGLSMLHELFVREHNSICDMLKTQHPTWSDEQLFQRARLINSAVMAKIHTLEWTPAVLPNNKLYHGMKDNWFGAVTKRLHSPDNRHVVTMFGLSDDVLGGIVGNDINKHNVPYTLTEEFDSVYRHLHNLLPDELQLHKIGDDGPGVTVPLMQTRMKASHKITDSMEMEDLFASFGGGKRKDGSDPMHPGQLVMNNYPKTLQNIAIPGFGIMDLGAKDVLADREHGVPRYNNFRRLFGEVPITSFDQITDNKKDVAKLRAAYNEPGDKKDRVDLLDLMIGTQAEGHRPDNFAFGDTTFKVFILNASRRLQADRFFTTDYNEKTYGKEGLEWVDQASMKNVLLRAYPKLAQTGLANVDIAFEPWDEGPLDPTRHPLAQCDQ